MAPAPAWDVVQLFPHQGEWSEQEYLELGSNRLVEYSHGTVEVLPMPTELHQAMVAILYRLLLACVQPGKLGKVLFAPLRVRLWPGKFREPDVVFMLAENAARRHNEYWEAADLVIEVVSDDDRRRDLETKRREYAQAKIPEYWIVDPLETSITVLRLDGDSYAVHGTFGKDEHATSPLLPGFEVRVRDVLEPDDDA